MRLIQELRLALRYCLAVSSRYAVPRKAGSEVPYFVKRDPAALYASELVTGFQKDFSVA
jgi:hypothetical protein